MPRYFYCILILLSLVFCSSSYTSVAPTWVTSNYMRAGSQDVIATLTGSSNDPTFIFTFSSPLPGVPNLAYGIKRYRGTFWIILRCWHYQGGKLLNSKTKFECQCVQGDRGHHWINEHLHPQCALPGCGPYFSPSLEQFRQCACKLWQDLGT